MKRLITLILFLVTSLCAYSQTSNSLKPVLLKDSDGTVTYYAFTPEQARFIIKAIHRSQISGALVDSLDSVVQSYDLLSQEHTQLIDSLASTNSKFYRIKVLTNQLNEKTTLLEQTYIRIIDGREVIIKRRNKLIRLLVTSNVVTAALLVILVL